MPGVRDATDEDLGRILDITNDAIVNTTAMWSYHPTTLDARRAWLDERRARAFPVLVAEVDGNVQGFASFGDFRPWDGYLHTVEHSIYVDPTAHRRGLGRAMLSELMERARALGKHAMIGGIEAENMASLALHRSLGFAEAGRLHQVGRKFNRWLDLVFMHRLLGG